MHLYTACMYIITHVPIGGKLQYYNYNISDRLQV